MRLQFHRIEVIRKDLQAQGVVWEGLDCPQREFLVVPHSSLLHQGRVGGEALYQRVLRRLLHLAEVGPVREYLDPYHVVGCFCSAGCETRQCQITAWNASLCGVTRFGSSTGILTTISEL